MDVDEADIQAKLDAFIAAKNHLWEKEADFARLSYSAAGAGGTPGTVAREVSSLDALAEPVLEAEDRAFEARREYELACQGDQGIGRGYLRTGLTNALTDWSKESRARR